MIHPVILTIAPAAAFLCDPASPALDAALLNKLLPD